jgi:phenylpropionate dioxygenase-like ring-hydroxylating dioxygenase large terminal subunit
MVAAASAAEREEAYLAGWRRFFHPVATTAELDAPRLDEQGRQQPLGVEVLGERLVLARLDGRIAALSGTCPHRGTGLHIGWIDPDTCRVVCRYHGAGWCGDGTLGSFPAIEIEGRQLPNWRIPTYQTVEKYGLVWVCLEPDPLFPVLQLPELDQAGFVATPWREQTWQAGVGRMVEATLDTYHFAFTHVGTIGDPSNPRAPNTRTDVVDNRLTFSYTIDQPANETIVNVAHEGSAEGLRPVTYTLRAIPNVVHLRKDSAAGAFVIFFAYCPVGPRKTRWYRLVVRNHDLDVPHQVFQDLEDRINAQDQHVIETMRPWELSTDLDAELQVSMDRPTVGYRKWTAEMGIRFL